MYYRLIVGILLISCIVLAIGLTTGVVFSPVRQVQFGEWTFRGTPAAVIQRIDQLCRNLEKEPITLALDGYYQRIIPRDWGIFVDVGAGGQPDVQVDATQLDYAAAALFAAMETPPAPARFVSKEGRVTIIPERSGVSFDLKQLEGGLRQAVLRKSRRVVIVRPTITKADRTAAALSSLGIRQFAGGYSTSLAGSDKNRMNNILLAVHALDNAILKPQKRLSFNGIVGPRTPDLGYKPALTIVDGEYVRDFGGGVCQVASTLYNAALTAGLTVLERTPHSLAPSYVPAGRDATVVYGQVDLVLTNQTNYNYVVLAAVARDTIKIEFFRSDTPTQQ